MTSQLPTARKPGALTPLPAGKLIPSLIADAGEQAAWRYVDFFTANIRNPTRAVPMGAPASASSPGARTAA